MIQANTPIGTEVRTNEAAPLGCRGKFGHIVDCGPFGAKIRLFRSLHGSELASAMRACGGDYSRACSYTERYPLEALDLVSEPVVAK